MALRKTGQKIDLGRIVAVPTFTFFLMVNIVSIRHRLEDLQPVNIIKAASLANLVFLICFYALVILLYFLRSSASSTARSWVSKVIAVMATFLPFTIPLLSTRVSGNPAVVIAANLIMILGMIFST